MAPQGGGVTTFVDRRMIRTQSSPMLMPLPLFFALLGMAFCAWSASGNSLNFCVTTGCLLYQDITVAGISMWWLGSAAFGVLLLLALLGRPWLGVLVAGTFILADIFLLILMLVTAPCVGCLFAAMLFALCYAGFRQHNNRKASRPSRSWMLLVWGLLFVINIGAVVRAEVSTWAISGPQDATVRVYFSPSCSACREAVNALSGRVNVAFYPIEESAEDVASIADMHHAVSRGAGMAEALAGAKARELKTFWENYNPDMLLLRFRLLRNKAHVMASGSHTVPFIEYQGLPAGLGQKAAASRPASRDAAPRDATLPLDGEIAGSCGGASGTPCP